MNSAKNLAKLMLMSILTAATSFTSCSDDNDLIEETANGEGMSLLYNENDQDGTYKTINDPTYVFGGHFSGEGQAIVARVKYKASSLSDAHVKNVIISGGEFNGLGTDGLLDIQRVLNNGGSLVVISPNAMTLKKIFDNGMTKAPISFDQGIAVLGISGINTYISPVEKNDGTRTIEMEDSEGNITQETIADDSNNTTAFYNGLKADDAATWMNNPAGDRAEMEASLNAATRAICDETKNPGFKEIDQIVCGQHFTFPYITALNYGIDRLESSKVTDIDNFSGKVQKIPTDIYIWSVFVPNRYSQGGTDYYFVETKMAIENQYLHCGPTKEDVWYVGNSSWKALKYVDISDHIYGPWMKSAGMECWMDGKKAEIVDYAPASASYGETITQGVDFKLCGDAIFNPTGKTFTINGKVEFSKTRCQQKPAINTMARPDLSNGKVCWEYSRNPDERAVPHWGAKHWTHTSTHESLRSLVVERQNWLWSVPISESERESLKTIKLKTKIFASQEWMMAHYSGTPFKCHKEYLTESNSMEQTNEIACPLRYALHIQHVKMTVDATLPHLSKKVEKELVKNFSNYFWTDSKDFITKEKGNDENDELFKAIKKAKETFDNNNSKMQKVGTDVGLLKGVSSYTITWVDADTGKKLDTYKVNIKR